MPRRSLYRWRHADPDFAREWDDAWEQGADLLEQVAYERAVNGSDQLLIFLLKGQKLAIHSDGSAAVGPPHTPDSRRLDLLWRVCVRWPRGTVRLEAG